jgi:translation initiation factor IF-2
VLHSGVGAISEADVNLAQASNALIIGFHVVAEDHAAKLAERGGVEIRTYRVIYELLQDVTRALEGLLAPVKTQELRAKVEVREVFHISRVGRVAGCYVTDGAVNRSHRLRLVRDGRIVLDDAGIDSLRRFKEDVREVRAGLECGIKIDGYDDVKPGDVLEAYEVVEVAADL